MTFDIRHLGSPPKDSKAYTELNKESINLKKEGAVEVGKETNTKISELG